MARGQQGKKVQRPPPVPPPADDADVDSVSAEDVAFVQSLRGRKPAFLTARLDEEEEERCAWQAPWRLTAKAAS